MKALCWADVHVHFGRLHALKGVELSLQRGEVIMLAGPNGAGKSTLLKVALGLVAPQSGGLTIDGQARQPDRAFRRAVGYLPESVAFSDNLTGRQTLRFFARARGVNRDHVERTLARVGLADAAGRRIRGYSRGMRQRLGIAVAILHEPELLILDEPTGGLDREGVRLLWSVLEEWRDHDRMVLICSHDLTIMERHIDRILILREGALVATGTPNELRAASSLPHDVTIELDAEVSVTDSLIDAVNACSLVLEQEGETLTLCVPQDQLLELMRVPSQFPDAVAQIRVQEAPFERVCEHLLRVA